MVLDVGGVRGFAAQFSEFQLFPHQGLVEPLDLVVGAAKPGCFFLALLAYLFEVALDCCVFIEELLGLGSFGLHFLALPLHRLVFAQDAVEFLKGLRILVLSLVILPSQLLDLRT